MCQLLVPRTIQLDVSLLPATLHSTHHPDANPALQGNGLYEEASVVNKQIYRILGKLPTIAAATWRHRVGRPYNYPESASTARDGGATEDGGVNRSWTANFLKLMVGPHDRLDFRPLPRSTYRLPCPGLDT